jgi:23S rRNA (adenine2503-C2)-methyltransferase
MKVLELTYTELAKELKHRYGKGAYHAAAIYREVFKGGNRSPFKAAEFAKSGELAQKIEADMRIHLPEVAARETAGNLTKIIFRLRDDLEVESVIVPMAKHATICISCQVGCRMGCRFCETAQLGFKRNLTVDEIVAQVWTARAIMAIPIRNVVFMGMGEPLDNFDNVIQAIRVLSDQRGLDIAKRHITLSTAGVVDGLERLAALNWPTLKLAVSLNAVNDDTRSRIMPINQRYPLALLRQTLRNFPLAKKGALLIEYILIPGINDGGQDARDLAQYIKPLKAKVNLIPHNPRRKSPYPAPRATQITRFQNLLFKEDIFVRLRAAKGREIMAACGQLGNYGRHAGGGALRQGRTNCPKV